MVKEKEKQSEEQQKRENMTVTRGGLIFLAIAALLVTASFLMSPVIENIFSKYRKVCCKKSHVPCYPDHL